MKNRIAVTLLVVGVLTGCATLGPSLGTKYAYTYRMTKPDHLGTLRWSDSNIDIAFEVRDTDLGFILQNRSPESMKVIWDEAVIVQYGEAKKIMHGGVKFIDRFNSQPPTILPSGTSMTDQVLPSENVYYRKGTYSTYVSSPGGWEEKDLFPTHDLNRAEYKEAILGNKGQTIGLYLPVDIGGNVIKYEFEFEVADVEAVTK